MIRIHRASSKRMDFFSFDELKLILDVVDHTPDYTINKLRFKLVCVLGATSGLRLFEILSLHVRDIMSGAYNLSGK